VEVDRNGLYLPNGTVGGRVAYLKGDYDFEWDPDGVEYWSYDQLLGEDWTTTNSPANPWDGVWVSSVGNPIVGTVRQATIGDLCPCEPCDPCLLTVNITVNGEAETPIEDVDPCVENTINIVIE
jgi:hypothetical protein